ncbi:MAG: ribonuclease T2-like [Chrysothrix sp. TS-e1954]|nr:MAG: ribonuclease T2-like [Chrysothrix sp. TS-e1954]
MAYVLGSILLLSGLSAAGCPASCPSDIPLSCHNKTAVSNTCCFNAPGGQLLQTQFWDSDPASGPADSWTVHGLWPDHCDGTYDQYCDNNRQYTNITQILESFGQNSLLSYMQKYWTDYHGNEESFWEHEWGKHGTCISTLEPSCYSDYTPQEEVVDFFTRTVALFKTLDTYSFLSDAGIVPSSTKNYTLKAVQAALKKPRGVEATVECEDGAIDEVYYAFDIKGSVQTGQFEPAKPIGETTNCGEMVAYLPKKENTEYPVSSVSSSAAATKSYETGCRQTST